ncbi:MAG: 50S ribosomal protein L11 [Candidatus Woesearchaeota archaeon]|nr:50S ribosomal protein L11 [Candidatus Aenigmarchaeota archaeon]MBU5688774.1 50S ribosomal protein L11 [Candidatus Aenigmarchaeota archaeon]
MSKETIEMLVEGGNAKPGPTTAPKFSQFKINMGELFNKINQETKEYKGMNVPVKVIIDTDTKEYTIKVGVPPVSSLIKKELGLDKIGSSGSKKDAAAKESGGDKKSKKKEEEKQVKENQPTQTGEKKIVGNLTIEQCIKIAKMKQSGLLSKNLKNAVKEIVGSCVSMPITVDGKPPKQVLKEIDQGLYDSKIQ